MSPTGAEETIQARRHRLSLVPRACEGCKTRKIRCDRAIPCSNCQASYITCRHPNDRTKTQLQADKVANLQALVELLDKRLRCVESKLAASEGLHRIPMTEVITDQSVSVSDSPLAEEGSLFEGDSSFTIQSLQASESAQIAALSAHTRDSSDIEDKFDYLRKTLRDPYGMSKNNFFFRKSASLSVLRDKILPATLVTSILRRMRARRPIFLSSYALNDLSLVESLCQNIYCKSAEASIGQIASMHGVLFFIMKELIAVNDELCQKFDLAAHLNQCEHNFVAGIETYEILAVPTFDNILALTMGVIKAQGEAKPSLYWTLVSAATTHCQSLGYHREATFQKIPSGKAESIRRIFWTVYILDKNMSLLLGRVSNTQGIRIDTRNPAISEDPALRPWDESFIMGIRLAEIQGRISTALYSTATLTKVSSERAQLVSELAFSMEKWHFELKQIKSDGVNNQQIFDLSRGNWDILFYSTLTLLFHATSSMEAGLHISSHCFDAARNGLLAHLNCFPKYQESQLLSDGDYFNWILLFSSFAPFIVTFLHAVVTKEMESVNLLEQVVSTLENFRKVSRGSERLYQICATFAHLAKKLIQSQLLPTGINHQQGDSIGLSDISGSTSPFHPEIFEDVFGVEDFDLLSSYATDILHDWANGQLLSWEKFDTT